MKNILNTLNSLLDKADKRMDVQSRMMDLSSEVGELSKEVLKSTQYGKKEFAMTSEFKEEYGDVLYAILCMGIENGIDIEDNINKMINKMNGRFNTDDDLSPSIDVTREVNEINNVFMKTLIQKLSEVATVTGRWDSMFNVSIHDVHKTIQDITSNSNSLFVKQLSDTIIRRMMEFVMPMLASNNIYISQADGYALSELISDLTFIGFYTNPDEMIIKSFCYNQLKILFKNPIMMFDENRTRLLIEQLALDGEYTMLTSMTIHSLRELKSRNTESSAIDYEKIFKTRLHALLEKYGNDFKILTMKAI